MRYALLAVALTLAACGSPDADPTVCSPACSPGWVCVSGVCLTPSSDAGTDALADAATADVVPDAELDGAADAPPDVSLDRVATDVLGEASTVDVPAEVGTDASRPADVPPDVAPDVSCGECTGGTYCYAGHCARTCLNPAGTPTGADCDGNAANGCETALGTNTHCGGCSARCAAPLECFPIRAEGVVTGYMCR